MLSGEAKSPALSSEAFGAVSQDFLVKFTQFLIGVWIRQNLVSEESFLGLVTDLPLCILVSVCPAQTSVSIGVVSNSLIYS